MKVEFNVVRRRKRFRKSERKLNEIVCNKFTVRTFVDGTGNSFSRDDAQAVALEEVDSGIVNHVGNLEGTFGRVSGQLSHQLLL